jgi:hypothetical protein
MITLNSWLFIFILFTWLGLAFGCIFFWYQSYFTHKQLRTAWNSFHQVIKNHIKKRALRYQRYYLSIYDETANYKPCIKRAWDQELLFYDYLHNVFVNKSYHRLIDLDNQLLSIITVLTTIDTSCLKTTSSLSPPMELSDWSGYAGDESLSFNHVTYTAPRYLIDIDRQSHFSFANAKGSTAWGVSATLKLNTLVFTNTFTVAENEEKMFDL